MVVWKESLILLAALSSVPCSHGLATSSPAPSSKPKTKKGYRVCTSSPCSTNGSELLLEALQTLATDDTTLQAVPCLGGCCSGTVIRPFRMNARRQTLPVMATERQALETARDLLLLLEDEDGLDAGKWQTVQTKWEAGERALEKSSEPELCSNCGVGLQLYRGNCAKCGKYPY